jgi:hypothetical protein
MMDESDPEKIFNLLLNFLPGTLNSLSSRSASFTIPIKGKGFINPFFRLLDFLNKNTKVS